MNEMKNTKHNWSEKVDYILNKHISLLSSLMIVLIFLIFFTLLRDGNIFDDTKMLAITSVMFILGIWAGFFIGIILIDLERRGILFKSSKRRVINDTKKE